MTSSQGAILAFEGKGDFPYFFTAVIFQFWQVSHLRTKASTAASTPGQCRFPLTMA
jgi:hypothetical protein